ncbi:response regulator [Methylotenera mobilis]|uniref:Response regulator receiver protein n=1 Tax=Methylotenera mobilis (strain JLW8 / ATCC BAA-1282 / DSM 17540) TaxID=583345 RepID=C6WUX3_METML|nr:response regulator [Methylotenera mobilis]ACT47722.1 response regulator receiver protein [Methylotenera mobilis JLW8]
MEKLLIIDDGYELFNSLQLSFGYDEYKISQAKNEQQAIKLAETEVPKIIIMNLTATGDYGLDKLKKLKETAQLKKSNLILLSTQAQQKEISKEVNDDATYFIPQPFSPNDLTTVLTGIRTKEFAKNSKISV